MVDGADSRLAAIGAHRPGLLRKCQAEEEGARRIRTLSAWESGPSGALTCPELRSWLSASDREIPVLTGVNGTLMARWSWPEPGLIVCPSWSVHSSGGGRPHLSICASCLLG